MKIIENERFDEERALYGSRGIVAIGCAFDGEADGESAFKESADITAKNCFFNLRYPFWHCNGVEISDCQLTELCRAALWYSEDIKIKNATIFGVKALRECKNANIEDSRINSAEFGWFCHDVTMENTRAVGEYFMLRSDGLNFRDVDFCGKYSFQYIKDSVFENCKLDTKDAFWHAENVTVRNCTVKGEYLGWYCNNMTFENCVIIGTQPFCYCRGLTLINCRMLSADLAFEKSCVNATLTEPILSIKNPRSGRILVPSVAEIIKDDEDSACEIIITEPSPV